MGIFAKSSFKTKSSEQVASELSARNYTPWGITYQSAAINAIEKGGLQGDYVIAQLNSSIVSSNHIVGIGKEGSRFVEELKISNSPLKRAFDEVGAGYGYKASDSSNSIPPPTAEQLLAVRQATQLCKSDGGTESCL